MMGVDVSMSEAGEGSRFGSLVRQHRTRIGLTQRELADFSTVSVRAIRDLEHGKARRPRQDTVRLIADGLRLGPKARAALETAANEGLAGFALEAEFAAAPVAPPLAPHPLVGREALVGALADQLAGGAERVVTLLGLGGVGKTRLALELAARLHADAGLSVLWHAFPGAAPECRRTPGPAGLSGHVDDCVRELFGPAVPALRLLHQDRMSSRAGDDSGADDGTGALAALISDRPALLVIDGVARTHRPRPEAVARLLRRCPELRILITAERPCALPGERAVPLAPLEIPPARGAADPEALGRVPAVRLFLDEARRVTPGYRPAASEAALVADICRRLDGLPAALRAAASWLVVYDLETLHQCLADGPATLLDHLAGAEGGFRVRAAVEHCLATLPDADAALLAALADEGADEGADGSAGFTVADVAALTRLDLPCCGRLVRELLLHGVVGPAPDDGSGRTRFRVLNLVRAARAATGRHAVLAA
jgi:predicted ATPase